MIEEKPKLLETCEKKRKKKRPMLATSGSCKSSEHLQVPAILPSVYITDELLMPWMSLCSCRGPLDSTE